MSLKATFLALSISSAALPAEASAADIYTNGVTTFQYYAYGKPYDDMVGSSELTTTNRIQMVDYYGTPFLDVTLQSDAIVYRYLPGVTWSPSVVSLDRDGLYVDNGAVIYSGVDVLPIRSVLIDPTSKLGNSGFDADHVTYNGTAVAVSWMGLHFSKGDSVIIRVSDQPFSAVPEPSTWFSLIVGFAASGVALRRRRRSSAGRREWHTRAA